MEDCLCVSHSKLPKFVDDESATSFIHTHTHIHAHLDSYNVCEDCNLAAVDLSARNEGSLEQPTLRQISMNFCN